jgi:hypothetical protein
MLYFLLQNKPKRLLEVYDCIGCNYKDDPYPHFSGNFWWVRCDYLSTLPLIEGNEKNDAEYHLFKKNPNYYSLHNSTVNHYHQRYPKQIYNEH